MKNLDDAKEQLGWVYVFSNPAFDQNLIKIGMSEQDPARRSEELQTTGVPEAFKVEYKALVVDQARVERVVHSELREFRNTKNREFFTCSVPVAIESIRRNAVIRYEDASFITPAQLAKEQMREIGEAEKAKEKAAALAIRARVNSVIARENKKRLDQEAKSERAGWIGLLAPVSGVLFLTWIGVEAPWSLVPLVGNLYFLFYAFSDYEKKYSDEESALIEVVNSNNLSDAELLKVASAPSPKDALKMIRMRKQHGKFEDILGDKLEPAVKTQIQSAPPFPAEGAAKAAPKSSTPSLSKRIASSLFSDDAAD